MCGNLWIGKKETATNVRMDLHLIEIIILDALSRIF